jgi:hypothetical protein
VGSRTSGRGGSEVDIVEDFHGVMENADNDLGMLVWSCDFGSATRGGGGGGSVEVACDPMIDLCFRSDVRRSRHRLNVSSPTRLKTSSMPSSSNASSRALSRLAIF